ncbi:hypothetical protein PL373_09360 [Tenacibaculum maritimum]|nr:hypothetical protein [Tenacibaculum maritimum]MDB0601352.1 hypothetical protein [Tenacibaculum maritimum]MDB0611773.1 hypothetical protein [Tenacibaculum maritimum]
MTPYQKIEKILTDEVIKASVFMKAIGLSKTAYYSIKKGKTKKFSESTAKKINEIYPNYSYKWLISETNDITEKSLENNELSKEQEWFVIDSIYNHEDILNKNKMFKAWVDAIKLEERKKTLQEVKEKR